MKTLRCSWCNANLTKLPNPRYEIFRLNGRLVEVCYGGCREAPVRAA